MLKKLGIIFFLLGTFLGVNSQEITDTISNEQHWVDSVYNSLTIEEQIAQLIFVRANYSGQPYLPEVDTLIKNFNIGGVVFFKGNPVSQALQTNHWNSLAKTPLFVAIDAEWGLGMRLSSTIKYPLQMTLGAINENNLIYIMGKQVAEQCKRMGIQINFAPVIDVNSNPNNPVIGMRSFGQNPSLVAYKGNLYMKGMQSNGLIACAKHFPGHGNTKKDSHKDLPSVNSSLTTLKDNDLLPFQYLINNGVSSIMIAHLSVPALDSATNVPSTLSHKIVTGLLKEQMGFGGLVITDGLDMKGVTKYYSEGMVALKALQAGNDILLIPDNVVASIQNIKYAIDNGDVNPKRLEESCKKVLKYKYSSGLYKTTFVDTTNLLADLNKKEYIATANKLFEESVTIVKNKNRILPLNNSKLTKKAVLIIGTKKIQDFASDLKKYDNFDVFSIEHNAGKSDVKKLISKLVDYDIVIAGVLNTNILAHRNFGITKQDIKLLEQIATNSKVILDIFASPYALNFFNAKLFDAIIVSYQEKPILQKASANLIMHNVNKFGTLPVDAGNYKAGWGLRYGAPTLYYENAADIGINTKYLREIDSIAINSIEIGAFPGCQILAAKNGAIFYNKAFGYHTYDSITPVKMDDVYDLASLTKMLATTAAIMKMTEDSIIDLNDKLSNYLLMLRGTNKANLRFKKVLSHQSGLQNWIPFYESTITDDGWDTTIFHSHISEDFPVRVAENMYVRRGYNNVLLDSIILSPFQDSTYHYSGLGFYLFKQMIENISNTTFDKYVYDNFYNKLNISRLRFTPREYFNIEKIIPTENDTIFRHQQLLGDVHDQGAALLGGVSGNAGLFGDAYDVAVMMQMFLNGGSYGDSVILKSSTINTFNHYYFAADSNRRGLGFDKPLLVYEDHRTNCKDASPQSFGHSGFTGTYAWVDPKTGLLYVFLSNRVYPDMNNSKLMDLDIRTNIHQLFYESLMPQY